MFLQIKCGHYQLMPISRQTRLVRCGIGEGRLRGYAHVTPGCEFEKCSKKCYIYRETEIDRYR